MNALVAIGAGVLLGFVYTISPMSVWFAIGAALLVWCGGRGLPPREARWVAWLVGTALAIRAAVLAAVFLFGRPDVQASFNVIFGDEQYNLTRALRQRALWLGEPMRIESFFDVHDLYGRSSYVNIMAVVELLVGPSPYGMRLLNILVFVGGVLLLHRLIRKSYGRVPAFVTLGVLLFLPTLVLWSVTALKESFNFFIIVAMLGAAIMMFRGPWWSRAAGLVGVVAAVVMLRTFREGAFAIGALGLAVGVAGALVTGRPWRFAAAVVLALAMAGPMARSPRLHAAAMDGVRTAALIHKGHVYTQGHSYTLLDWSFYIERNPVFTWSRAARYAGRAVVSVLVFPAPWQIRSRSELAYLPEQMLWYCVLAMAAIGVAEAFRRDAVATSVLLGYAAVALFTVGLSSGNIGTLIRHRGFALPYIVAIGAVGLTALVSRFNQIDDRAEMR